MTTIKKARTAFLKANLEWARMWEAFPGARDGRELPDLLEAATAARDAALDQLLAVVRVQATAPADDRITVNEAATLADMSVATMWRARDGGELKTTRRHGRTWFSREEVVSWSDAKLRARLQCGAKS